MLNEQTQMGYKNVNGKPEKGKSSRLEKHPNEKNKIKNIWLLYWEK